MDLRFTFLLLALLSLLAVFAKPAHAANEYLNSDQHCSGASLEPYIEYSQNVNRGAGENVNNGYRYKGLELGPDFKELKDKCTQVWKSDALRKKHNAEDENIKDKKIKELERKLKANEDKNKTKD